MAINILRGQGYDHDDLIREITRIFYIDLDEYNDIVAKATGNAAKKKFKVILAPGQESRWAWRAGFQATVLYLNQGNMEHKPLDPVRAPIIRTMFELAATGDWSLAALARYVLEQGFTMPPVRRPRTEEERLAELGPFERDAARTAFETIHTALHAAALAQVRRLSSSGAWSSDD